jgi:hypothetical protein
VNMVVPEVIQTYQGLRNQGQNAATTDAFSMIEQTARTPTGFAQGATNVLQGLYQNGGMDPTARNFATQLTNGGVVNPATMQAAWMAGGNEVGRNPYLDATYNRAAQSVTQNFRDILVPGMDRQFIGSGRTGSGMYAQARGQAEDKVASSLGDLATQVYGGAYESERGRQMQALGMLGELGQQGVQNRLQGVQALDNGLARQLQGTQMAGAVDAMRYAPAERLYQLGQSQSYLPYQNQLQFLDILSKLPGYSSGNAVIQSGAGGPSPVAGAAAGAVSGAAAGAPLAGATYGLSIPIGAIIGGAGGYFGSGGGG